MKFGGSARDQKTIVLVALLGMVILWVYAVYILGPIHRASKEIREQMQKAKKELSTVESTVARQPSLQQEQQRVEASVGSVRGIMPSETQLPNVIESISGLAAQSELKIQTIFPYRPMETQSPFMASGQKDAGLIGHSSPYYKETLIQIDALAGYHELGKFLSSLEAKNTPIRLATLRIAPYPKETRRQNIKMLLKAYFTPSEDEPAEQGAIR